MSLAGIAAAGPLCLFLVRPKTKTSALPEVQTGNREWTYEVVCGWGSLPSSTSFGLLGWFFSDRLWNLLRSSIGKLLRSPTFQLSLDVRNGFTSPADAGTAVNQRGPFHSLIRFPNLLQLRGGKSWMLVVANWNVFSPQSASSIVGDQTSRKLLIQV